MSRVAQDGQNKSSFDFWAGHDWSTFCPEKVGKTSVEKAAKLLGAKPAKTGNYDIVFDNDQASAILGTFWSALNADRVHKGFSLFKGKLGEKVASDNVTIRDDALLDLKSGSCPFDDEGVAASNKVVVESGVLRTFLHSTKTAKIDGVKPTGNGAKTSYASALDIQPNNLYIVPTKTTKDQLVKEMGNGLLITDLAGLHSGANPVSGDFSLSAGGFLVENGEITTPVEQITVAGNFFALLNSIVKVADDLDQLRSNIASPSIWVKGITVSGA
jgi:PmbA protein